MGAAPAQSAFQDPLKELEESKEEGNLRSSGIGFALSKAKQDEHDIKSEAAGQQRKGTKMEDDKSVINSNLALGTSAGKRQGYDKHGIDMRCQSGVFAD